MYYDNTVINNYVFFFYTTKHWLSRVYVNMISLVFRLVPIHQVIVVFEDILIMWFIYEVLTPSFLTNLIHLMDSCRVEL